jgi:hypothetical protein
MTNIKRLIGEGGGGGGGGWESGNEGGGEKNGMLGINKYK